MENRITIHILTRDRHSELALLLQSLRTQTYQNFDIVIVDDASGTPLVNCQFLIGLFNRLKLENHKIKLVRNPNTFGCCYGRNKCIDEDDFENPLTLRLDDDVILEPEYIEKLLKVIDKGYDMASGVVPLLINPEVIRDTNMLFMESSIINEHKFDKEGNLILQKDECGYCYDEEIILPTHQFRTNCLYKSKIHKKIRYPDNLTTVAFREEGFFSMGAISQGFFIGINTDSIAYHLQTQSGGNRRADYNECVAIDNQTFLKYCKKLFEEHGDFLTKYNKEVVK